jgi:hypothetical protein
MRSSIHGLVAAPLVLLLAGWPAACTPNPGGGTGGTGGAGAASSSTTTASASTSSAGGGMGGAGTASSSSSAESAGSSSSTGGGTGGAGGTGPSSASASGSGGASSSSTSSSGSSASSSSGGPACGTACQWLKRSGDAQDQAGSNVAIDPSGNVVVQGSFQGTIDLGGGPLVASAPGTSYFIAKLDPGGNHLWSKSYAVSSVTSVAVDASGNVLFGGTLQGTADLGGGPVVATNTSSAFVTKLGPAGNYLWTTLPYSPGFGSGADALAADAAGNVVLAARYATMSPLGNFFLAKLGPSGNVLWTNDYGTGAVGYPTVRASGAGDIFLTGNPGAGSSFPGCLFIAKLDPAGHILWKDGSTCQSPPATHLSAGYALAVDAAGDAYLTTSPEGVTAQGGVFSFGNTSGGCAIPGPAPRSVVLKVDGAQGGCQWARSFEGGQQPVLVLDGTGSPVAFDDIGQHLYGWSASGDAQPPCSVGTSLLESRSFSGAARDPGGRFVTTGSFTGSFSFTNTQITAAGGKDAFLLKL